VTFEDRFARVATGYATFRPRYPSALLAELAAHAPGKRWAWDCATGSGQAACGLAEHFARVVATDASAAQLSVAVRHPRVHYVRSAAEASGLASGSIDLVTVAQALHWLDVPALHREVARVLVPRGIVAEWCYSRLAIAPELDPILDRFYGETVGPYWPPGREHVEAGYRTLEFPFERIESRRHALEKDMTLADLGGYLRTWSATEAYTARHGRDPVAPLIEEIRPLWGEPAAKRRVRWPLAIRVGRL
jgi:ubiquinone/menaquinone biosynthesis C-methylase UbiE